MMPSLTKERGAGREHAGAAPYPRTSALAGLRPTGAGLAFIGVIVIITAAAMSSEANLLFLVACLSVGMVAVSVVVPVLTVRRVEVERELPQAVVAGRSFTMAYRVRNGRRWGGCWSLTVGESPGDPRVGELPLAYVPHLGSRGTDRLELLACCPRRGPTAVDGNSNHLAISSGSILLFGGREAAGGADRVSIGEPASDGRGAESRRGRESGGAPRTRPAVRRGVRGGS